MPEERTDIKEPLIPLFVPGRLCLFGEHSDWAGIHRLMNADILPGEAIVTGIEEGISAEICRSGKFEMTSSAPELAEIWEDCSLPLEIELLKDVAQSDSFFANAAGTAAYILGQYHIGGLAVHLTKMSLPIKKGLSSSAAICVLIARAFNRLYHLNLSTSEEMETAFQGEQQTRSRCGRLDQACAFGTRPVQMTFDGNSITAKPILVGAPIYLVFADLNAGKDTIKILSDLSRAYPFPGNEPDRLLHEALGADNRRIIAEAIESIRKGDSCRLGRLMTESQQIFDQKIAPHSPEELRSPRLHAILADPEIARLTWGGKGVGSHGDGSIQFTAKDSSAQKKLLNVLRNKGLTPFELTLHPSPRVKKGVIPAAGAASRLFPASRGTRKEFFPVIDRDGFAKPAVLILLEELLASGIEEICLVISSEEDRMVYENFFAPLSESDRQKLSRQGLEIEKRMNEIHSRLRYSFQPQKRGFGDAVYRARSFAGSDPVILLLCDTIYRSRTDCPCAAQLIDAYTTYGKPMIAVHSVPPETAERCGMVTGTWEDDANRLMKINRIAEKPGMEYAQSEMAVPDRAGLPRYYSIFGEYIITPEIFDELEKEIDSAAEGEIDLTGALSALLDREGLFGFVPEGEAFDLGTPAVYRESVYRFG